MDLTAMRIVVKMERERAIVAMVLVKLINCPDSETLGDQLPRLVKRDKRSWMSLLRVLTLLLRICWKMGGYPTLYVYFWVSYFPEE